MDDYFSTLFDDDVTSNIKAYLSGKGAVNDLKIANGYLWAAQAAVRAYQNSPMLDAVFYPVVFLLRHALELAIKTTLHQIIERHGLSFNVLFSHDLTRLLEELEISLDKIGGEPLLEVDRHTIYFLNQIDPAGDRFRYQHSRRNDADDLCRDEPFSADLGKLLHAVSSAYMGVISKGAT